MTAAWYRRKGLGRISRMLPLALWMVVGAIAPCRGDLDTQTEAPQTEWLAFIAEENHVVDPTGYFFYDTPTVILYRDGRIVRGVFTSDLVHQQRWLEGTVDKEHLERFIAQMQASPFVQKHTILKDKYSLDWQDRRTQTIGIHAGGKPIIYKPFMRSSALPEGADKEFEPTLSAVRQAAGAIRSLIPRQSHPYVPTSIRVWFDSIMVRILAQPPKAHIWPVSGERLPTRDFVRIYSGKAMAKILATLQQTFLITDGVRKVMAQWRPDVEIPVQDDPYATVLFKPEWWRVSKEGAFNPEDGTIVGRRNMVRDLLSKHLQTGMTPDEVGKLLGKPDATYVGPSLAEFGSNLPTGAARIWEWLLGRGGEDSDYLLVLFNKTDTLMSANIGLH